MSGDLVLGVDCGTQSIKAQLFDEHGGVVAKSRVPITDYRSPHPGWHEHDPGGLWDALCMACTELWRNDGALRDRVAGVGMTVQRAAVVNVDRQGRALRPAITGLDQRKSPVLPKLSLKWQLLFGMARVTNTIRYLQTEAEVNWIRASQPEIWAQTHKYLLLSGYLIQRLSGRYVDSIGAQVGYVPFDFKRQAWAADGDWRWEVLPVPRDMLPELVAPGTVIGELTKDAAEATGLPRGTPLIATANDKGCEMLGAGCREPSVACISYGTIASIAVTSQRYVEVFPLIPSFPAAIPNAYSAEVLVVRGYWMVTWFKEQFGLLERLAAERGDTTAEELLERLIEGVPPGAMGLMLQPYWTPGLRTPGPEAKGAIIGFGEVHTRAHLYRSIIEGIAFALREGKERIERRLKTPITSLRVVGGGSKSDAAMQITSDVFGLPAARMQAPEAGCLGAAIDAAVGLGVHADFETAVRAMTRVERTFEPRAQQRAMYDALYSRVYLCMYERLKPLFEAIRQITGYPEGS
jgi:sugar (pentulose or hexulose) kinase